MGDCLGWETGWRLLVISKELLACLGLVVEKVGDFLFCPGSCMLRKVGERLDYTVGRLLVSRGGGAGV